MICTCRWCHLVPDEPEPLDIVEEEPGHRDQHQHEEGHRHEHHWNIVGSSHIGTSTWNLNWTRLSICLLQMKYILFVGENTAGTDDIKMRQAIQNKIGACRLGRNRFCTQAREKGAEWFAESKYDQGEQFSNKELGNFSCFYLQYAFRYFNFWQSIATPINTTYSVFTFLPCE